MIHYKLLIEKETGLVFSMTISCSTCPYGTIYNLNCIYKSCYHGIGYLLTGK